MRVVVGRPRAPIHGHAQAITKRAPLSHGKGGPNEKIEYTNWQVLAAQLSRAVHYCGRSVLSEANGLETTDRNETGSENSRQCKIPCIVPKWVGR